MNLSLRKKNKIRIVGKERALLGGRGEPLDFLDVGLVEPAIFSFF